MIDVERLTSEFARMAAIASPSLREGEISRYLGEVFVRLGGEVFIDDAGGKTGSESGNLIVSIPGNREGEPILLSAHMDTVEPSEGVLPVLKDGIFTSAGETILGADDKAGLAEIIEALTVLREQGFPHGPIEVAVTVGEEAGLLGAKHLDFSRIRARRGLVLDTSGIDLLIHKAPCANKLRFEIIGREAHAGLHPERGISAIEVAARAIDSMRLGRIDEETTANIGKIQGGQAINIVPKHLFVEGEARSHSEEKLARQTEHMMECFRTASCNLEKKIDGKVVRAEIRSEVTSDYPRIDVPLDSPIVRLVQEASARLDRSLVIKAAGGGSDANIFNSRGIDAVILGTGMCNVHTVDESVRVEDMVRVTELLVEVLRSD